MRVGKTIFFPKFHKVVKPTEKNRALALKP